MTLQMPMILIEQRKYGIATSESVLVTATGAEILSSKPYKLYKWIEAPAIAGELRPAVMTTHSDHPRHMYHSNAAQRVAVRGLAMCGRTTLKEGAIEADFEALGPLCVWLCERLDSASEIPITTPAGTEVAACLDHHRAMANTAILHGPGLQGRLTIEAFVAGTRHFALGRNASVGGRSAALIHLDMANHKPSISLDGLQVLADGALPT